MTNTRRIATRCVHGGKKEEKGPATVPIAQTSTFIFENQQQVLDSVTGKSGEHLYTRWSNPTTRHTEEQISAIEGTEESLLVSSGMAAISSTVLSLVSERSKILTIDSIYGGTLHLFEDILPNMGVQVEFVPVEKFADKIEESKGEYDICYFETPTNPTLKIVDIEQIANVVEKSDTVSVIDSTFATPYNQQPHPLGIDIVIHSATKYLGGHSDLIAGVASGESIHIEQIRETAKLLGGTIDPFASFLLNRGIKTLDVRMSRHNENALFLAKELNQMDEIKRVFYPGLNNHVGHKIAEKQMNGFGGVLTIEINATHEETRDFVDGLEIFLNATSLGGVKSLASMPTLTSHYGIDEEVLHKMDISGSTVRLSVGIEDKEDLLADIEQSMDENF
ncbi:MAG: PLP-dependent aspartate aminotransferase family protein [Candidatus Thorarchaeota archaeon]